MVAAGRRMVDPAGLPRFAGRLGAGRGRTASKIGPGSVSATFFIFLALFTALLIAELSIMFRQIKIGPENEKQ